MPRPRSVGATGRPRIAARVGRTPISVAHFQRDAEVSRLRAQVRRLKGVAATQQRRIEELQQKLDESRAVQPDEIIEIREISREQAREEIVKCFQYGEPLDHADLADALALEISLVIEVCNELIEEGVVVFYDNDRR